MRRDMNAASSSAGFTLVELMVVVLIIGILVAIVTPVFWASTSNARRRTCFANERTLEGCIAPWQAGDEDNREVSDLTGVVNSSHPLVVDRAVARAPRCPSAPEPADPANPTVAEGAYSFDASGTVDDCTFGELGNHGHYN